MEMMIYLDGKIVGVASGCEFVGEVWVQTQKLAELLCVDCALVSAETGEVLVLWEPYRVPFSFCFGASSTIVAGANFYYIILTAICQEKNQK